jgi:hypothetical protein
MLRLLCCTLILLMAPVPLALAETAGGPEASLHPGGPETATPGSAGTTAGEVEETLRDLAERDALTVRALIAYDRLPASLRSELLGLRSEGIDILGQDAAGVERLLQEEGERLSLEQSETLGQLLDTLQGITALPRSPDSQTSREATPSRPPMPPMQLPPAIDPVAIGEQQYAGLITMAVEAMRALAGPMSASEQARFEARWQRYRAYPSAEIVAYFREATPLLAELVNLNEAMAVASAAFDEAWSEAMLAAEYESEKDTAIALSLAARQRDLLGSMQQRADEIAAALAQLGDPPDPDEAQARASRRHADAVAVVREMATKPTLEGVWIGSERVKTVGQDGDGWIDGIQADPLLFVIYAAGTHDAPEYRGLLLNPEDPQEARDNENTPYVVVLPLDGGDGDAPPLLPTFQEGQLHWFHTEVDEDMQWEITVNARRLEGSDATYPPALQRDRVEQAFEQTLARIEDERAALEAAQRKQAAGQAGSDNGDIEALVAQITDNLQSGLDDSASATGLAVDESLARSTLGDFRRQYRWTGPFLAASAQWLEERPFTDTQNVEEDRDAFLALLEPRIAEVESRVASAPAEPRASEEDESAEAGAQAAEEAEALRQERIAFHQANIRIVERNLERDRADLAEASDPERRAQLQFRIVTALSDIQYERDRIASIETGETVHNRTVFDDYAHDGMIINMRKTQQEIQRFEQSTQALYRLAGMLPEDEAATARAFIDRQLTPDVMAQRDRESLERIAQAVGHQVQGHYQQREAAADEQAAWAMLGEEAATNIRTAADQSLMVLSIAGGQPVETAYQAVTGYIEGGPAEAAMRAASNFSTRASIAVEALRGYQDGGLEGAAKRAAVSYAFAKGMEVGMGKIMARRSRTTAGVDASSATGTSRTTPHPTGVDTPSLSRLDVDEQRALAAFKRARKQGEDLVADFQQAQRRLTAAGAAGRPAQEIIELQTQVRAQAAAINGSPHAKNFLKYRGTSDTQRAYNAHLRAVHAEVEANFHQRMQAEGWNQTAIREMRNASSAGSVGMDFDIGLDRSMVGNLSRNGKRASGYEWQVEASQAWEASYQQVTGHRADLAWENITTPAHPESYRDMAWLAEDKSAVQRVWGQQAADVSRYKSWHMLNDPSLSRMEALQEVSRGTAKDIQTKLGPMLDAITPQSPASVERLVQSRDHWRQVQRVLSDFGDNTIDPLTANRRIREITGGKDIPQVADEMAMLLESVVRLGRR